MQHKNIHLLFWSLLLPFIAGAQNLNVQLRAKLTFPGQTLANVWGYTAPDGREYALAGGSLGLIIVEVTNPDQPQQIVQIPGPNSLWKEVKTYGHYAYVVSEGGQGIQIVNLQGLPSPTLPNKFYKGNGAVNNQINRLHALHIDTTKGYLYAYGGNNGNLFGGGAVVFDLNADPWNPNYVGKFDQLGYIHDGYVDNDMLYSGHIYGGQFAIVDMSDKANPLLLATQNTPGNFTHNTWLTDDRRTLLTTDEVSNSYLAAYDVSDPTDIKFLDRIQSNPGSNSIVHNTHILGNHAVTAWYKDGVTIVDVTRPDNLVQVGNYDTYPQTGSGFDGCWGVYPYFPSGTAVATNITAPGANTGELFVLTPTYARACYLEGRVTDAATGAPLNAAVVQIVGTGVQESSGADGVFKMGRATGGVFTARVAKTGYQSREYPILLEPGHVFTLNAALYPQGSLTISGEARRRSDSTVVVNADVHLYGIGNAYYHTTTNTDGQFTLTGVAPGQYDIIVEKPKPGKGMLLEQVLLNSQTLPTIYLSRPARRTAERELEAGEAGFHFQAGPNPFQDRLSFRYEGLSGQNHRLCLLDTQGKLVWETALTDTNGQCDMHLTLPPGAYLACLKQGDTVLKQMVLVRG